MRFDLLIRGGTLIDGTGAAARPADVAILDGRIAAVNRPEALATAGAQREIDARGRLVTPGFIDIHTHSDRSILVNPRMESKLRQGVTTEVGGNCGSGVAPVQGEALAAARRDPPTDGEPNAWPTLADYLAYVEQKGIAGNYATWAAHGTLRASVVGYAMRPPTAAEQQAMERLLHQAMEAGAFGVSTGLIYAPSGFAATDEIVALAQVARRHGGLYASHIRNESDKLVEAVGEAIEIGRRADIPVQIAHHKASQRPNWGQVQHSLALMDDARRSGVDVACDQYPYTASSTGLSSVLPQWALEGGRAQLTQRLRQSDARAAIRQETLARRPDYGAAGAESAWHTVQIARCRGDRALEGRRLDEIAAARDADPFEVCFDLLIQEQGNVGCVFFSMCEEDVQAVMRWPHTMVGSDASSVAPYGPLGEGKPHPRAYGTHARVLGRYVRELGVLSWEEAVHKMTAQPAARLGLTDRGAVRPGSWADLVVLDPAAVADRATFEEPHQYAAGIEHVLVNGVPVIQHGEHTGALPGQVLRKKA